MASFKVYLAGSIPKSKEEKESFVDWRQKVVEIFERLAPSFGLNKKVLFLNPNTADYDAMPTEKFFGRDIYMIKISNALVIDATEKLGIGTSQEFLIAKYYKKPTIVISPNGSHYNKTIRTEKSDNFHYIHPFLKSTSDIIVDSHEEAVMVLLGHFSGKKTILPKTIKMIESARQDYAKNFMHLDKYMADFTKSKNGYL